MTTTDSGKNWLTPLLASWRAQRAWILEQQIAIARVAAPTGNESERAALLQQDWRNCGHHVTSDGAGNVIARVDPTATPHRTDGRPLVCLAHLDTVFDAAEPLAVRQDGTRTYCPGIGDNGRGLAAMSVLARILRQPDVRARLQRPIELVLTVGEEGEGNLRGATQWFDDASARGAMPVAAVAIDGPGDRTIVHHAVGSRRWRIAFTGVGGHSWANATTPNPVHAAGACIAAIARLADASRPYGVIAVTRMHGGEHLTGVPTHAWIDVDLRSLDPERLRTMAGEVERIVRRAALDASQHTPAQALRYTITTLGDRPAGMIDEQHPLVIAAAAATRAVGRVPQSASASTDANVPLSRGIPAIAIGAGGSGSAAHTANEWYDDTDSDIGIERLLRLIVALGTAERLSG
ncbi:M20/M25/M40 family metallo-hydrolase [Gemmatimonas groenlandica]|uniref:M20/M25/M40 family metallo-hydrolase n=1 Tax=Gemmatimonas groenlandica TaxID=2732249 RepID=A0A6M4IID1_9BACT|nr:M20/M25/M40 family metallo-hydrolase [Gemmatimonas groenlandica]QJR34390.1 M20/M25/M40 family metallo-hydrolase [Gemmatimonas groenlandica]